ncbi:MAG: pilus assembly protein [Pirellulaceae bacterium]|nr:pilus assembly protein [Pirellulaceae bacterium]
MRSRHGHFPPWRCRQAHRRGLATMWLIMFGPVFLVMLYFVVEIGHLYLAKTELNNALEAAAQAGAQRWSEGGTTAEARANAYGYAQANTVSGDPVELDTDEDTTEDTDDPPANPNNNVSCDGEIVLGAVNATDDFDANEAPTGALQFGVRVRKTVSVEPLSSTLLGISMGPFDLSGDVTAACATGDTPRLIRLNSFTCTSP